MSWKSCCCCSCCRYVGTRAGAVAAASAAAVALDYDVVVAAVVDMLHAPMTCCADKNDEIQRLKNEFRWHSHDSRLLDLVRLHRLGLLLFVRLRIVFLTYKSAKSPRHTQVTQVTNAHAIAQVTKADTSHSNHKGARSRPSQQGTHKSTMHLFKHTISKAWSH